MKTGFHFHPMLRHLHRPPKMMCRIIFLGLRSKTALPSTSPTFILLRCKAPRGQ
ncbi:uncharacterized protein LACBIDRAFT_308749 [Laccaria bicolor S238N-H82]|uniref:Predicted protein n=1 Tax=Laccaria bicolor (strain S238N-H82 / ATCC MYA-4686) TaxID=486041 RepID=B0CX36_LACBS|nr:uncharacterized protein LACBIDRAFT_308749 [Laccaria bicolor S238N-H82]EDR13607.1 predicted protein [Laccaria bicolor S238N-H82]|eukprot:XP_001876105.1 predicted protein [Laccaria bicolor S238N-H82]